MSRRKLIAGNWKMNKTAGEASAFLMDLQSHWKETSVDVVCCIPAISLVHGVSITENRSIAIGAQNMHFEEKGAYTGEISPRMLVEAGVSYVILGHSERREYFAETDETVAKKVNRALEHGLIPILCCGESLAQREQGITLEWIRSQLKIALQAVTPDQMEKVVIAYEPIWAIGTGKVATAEQAQEVCHAIRDLLAELYSVQIAEKVRILYGGSMAPGNAEELLAEADIDGGLIGGASLTMDFLKIVEAAAK